MLKKKNYIKKIRNSLRGKEEIYDIIFYGFPKEHTQLQCHIQQHKHNYNAIYNNTHTTTMPYTATQTQLQCHIHTTTHTQLQCHIQQHKHQRHKEQYFKKPTATYSNIVYNTNNIDIKSSILKNQRQQIATSYTTQTTTT